MKVYELHQNGASIGVYLPGYIGESEAMREELAYNGTSVEEVPGWRVYRIAMNEHAGIFTAEHRNNEAGSPDYGVLTYSLIARGMVCGNGFFRYKADECMEKLSAEFGMEEVSLINGEINPAKPPRDLMH